MPAGRPATSRVTAGRAFETGNDFDENDARDAQEDPDDHAITSLEEYLNGPDPLEPGAHGLGSRPRHWAPRLTVADLDGTQSKICRRTSLMRQ